MTKASVTGGPAVPVAQRTRRPLGFGGWRDALMVISLSGIMLMALMDLFIVNVALPSLGHELHATGAELQVIVASYALTDGALLLVGARLGDRYGRVKLAITGIVVFVLASVGSGVAATVPEIVLGRLMQGVGAGLMVPQVLAIMRTTLDEHDLKRAVGFYSATAGLGAIVGQVIGGLLISANWAGLGWRLVFFINVPIAFAVSLGIVLTVPRAGARGRAPRVQLASFDGTSACLWAVAIGGLMAPLLFGRATGWDPLLAVSASAGLLASGLLVARERAMRRANATGGMVTGSVFSFPGFRESLSLLLVLQAALGGLLFIFVITFQTGLGLGTTAVGLALVVPGVAFAAASIRQPGAGNRALGHPIAGGLVVMASGLLVLASVGLVRGQHMGLLVALPGLLIFGVGLGMCFAPSVDRAVQSVPPRFAGVAAGLAATAIQVGTVVGVAAIGTVFFSVEKASSGSSAHTAVAAYSWSLVAAALTLLMIVALLVARRSVRVGEDLDLPLPAASEAEPTSVGTAQEVSQC